MVLCGGGSRGAMEVGFYKALHEAGVRVDFILGCSIGALNGAFIAGGMPPSELARLWTDFRLRQAVGINWTGLHDWRHSPGPFSLSPLCALLRRMLPATRFEKLAIPLTVVTTDFESGSAVYWGEKGDLVEPVIASMSLPGIFPPLVIDGRLHVDGGLSNNVPLDKAEELGAGVAYLIECACAQRCAQPLRGWKDLVVRSFSIAVGSRYAAELDHYRGRVEIHAIRPHLDHEVDLLDFRHTAQLIETAYRQTCEYLERLRTSAGGSSTNPPIGSSRVSPLLRA
jgi:NTE family protein